MVPGSQVRRAADAGGAGAGTLRYGGGEGSARRCGSDSDHALGEVGRSGPCRLTTPLCPLLPLCSYHEQMYAMYKKINGEEAWRAGEGASPLGTLDSPLLWAAIKGGQGSPPLDLPRRDDVSAPR